MGYTHYWNFIEEPSKEKFVEFVEGVKQIVATAQEAGIDITDEEYGDDKIVFNGVGADAHETFFVSADGVDFNFCKTAQKPYDIAVTASLIHAKKVFGDNIKISSDGDWSDWEGGQLLYESVYDIQPESFLRER
jgi:hypothetical protein